MKAVRRARRGAWLPFAAMLLMIAAVVAAVALLSVGHIGVVADTLVVTLCLVPLAILLLPLVVGVIVGIWALAGADRSAVQRLLSAEQRASALKAQIQSQTGSAGGRLVGIVASIERLDPLWRLFDKDEDTKGGGDGAQSAEPEQPAGT